MSFDCENIDLSNAIFTQHVLETKRRTELLLLYHNNNKREQFIRYREKNQIKLR